MNTVGWLGGGGAPLLVGLLADHYGLSLAIAVTAVVYLAAGSLLALGAIKYVDADAAAVRAARG